MTTQTALQILVTGFGAFPGVEDNPCAFLIEQLRHTKTPMIDNVDIHPHALKTAWQKGPHKLATLYKKIEPDIALHFGYAQSAQGFCFEQYAHNTTLQELDCYGDMPPHHKVVIGGPSQLQTPYPITQMKDYLQSSGLPAQTSTDAGHYLCNMIYYYSCSFSQGQKQHKTHSLFIHIPPIKLPSGQLIPAGDAQDLDNFLSHQQLMAGVWQIMRYCRDFHIMEDDHTVMM